MKRPAAPELLEMPSALLSRTHLREPRLTSGGVQTDISAIRPSCSHDCTSGIIGFPDDGSCWALNPSPPMAARGAIN